MVLLTAGFVDEIRKYAKVETPLKEYQQRVVDRIQHDDQPGLVVAHGLGSGKTLTSIAAQDALGTPATVVVPAALQANYLKERDRHLTGKKQPINLKTLQMTSRQGGELAPSKLLIVDEAHRGRDPASSTFKALRDAEAEKKLLLTASPFYNSPHDLAPLINIAAGKSVLPNEKAEFDSRYIRNERVRPSFTQLMTGIRPGSVQELNPSRAGELRKVYGKWVDYHPGSTENFPTVARETVEVPMADEQLKVYDTIMGQAPSWVARKVKAGLPPSKSESKQMNAFLGGARQAALSTNPFSTGEQQYAPKIDKAFERLQEEFKNNPEARAVIYSNYLQGGVSPYAKRLSDAGIPFGEYTGEVKKQDRDQLVKDYNTGAKKVMLLSSAGGEGLDLKGTRLIQMLEPHWNAEKLKQVEGRGIRYGSHAHLPEDQRNVKVESYIATRPRAGLLQKIHLTKPGGSVDQYLAARSAEKERLIDQFKALLPNVPPSQAPSPSQPPA